jgi:hypothetical protein
MYKHFVGVDRKDVRTDSSVSRNIAVWAKSFPWVAFEHAGNTGKLFSDNIHSAVGRAGIANGVVVYIRSYRTEAALNNMRLVLDDHAKAE